MIGWLSGRVLARSGDSDLLVDVHGVGYRCSVPVPLVASLQVGAEVELHVHTHVREDAIVLYGFATTAERRCFELLLSTHGVGPTLALGILSTLRPEALARAVVDDDLDTLSSVPGVGRKTAARLALDLKNRLTVPDQTGADGPVIAVDGSAVSGVRREVRAALAELGYGSDEIRLALADAPDEGPVEQQLRQALRQLARAR